tara:strand:- start:891 stop:2141 length:1251 start_codon:yes stop_codon:yes gene_type:complete
MIDDKTLANIATSVNTTVERLKAMADEVLIVQGDTWRKAGKDEDSCQILSLRVAQQKINRANSALARSGANNFVGMFISVPRVKEWGKILYNKMKNDLGMMNAEVKETLIRQGKIVMFEKTGDSYIMKANPNLSTKQRLEDDIAETTVTVLPDAAIQINETESFYLVWDYTNPSFPNGNANFKFGLPKPQDERERTAMFFGRQENSTDAPSIWQIKANGKEADTLNPPSFTAGRIALKAGRNGGVAYCVRGGVSTFQADDSLESLFQDAPFRMDNNMMAGSVPNILGQENLIPEIRGLEKFHRENALSDGWYQRLVATKGEVLHIEPKDNGAVVLVVGDEDLSSVATADIWVSGNHAKDLNFGVASKMFMVGQTWETRDGEVKYSVTGWFPYDIVEAASIDNLSLEDGNYEDGDWE